MTGLRVALLGGFALRGDDAPAEVRGLIPQAILARLAVARGEPLDTAALVAELWPDPPAEVVSSLRAHVSRLRSRGWGDVLAGGRDGYALDPDRVTTDVQEFESLVAGEGGDRVAELTAALALWRPDPLGWARGFPFAAPLADRLTAVRRRAALELADALDAADDPAEAASRLRELIAEVGADPELETRLARSLARTGRASEALRLLDTRADDDRHDDASAVRSAIRRHEHEEPADVTAPVPGILRIGVPSPATPLVGRAEQLQAVLRARAASRLVTLTGPAGVGKTRLAVEVAWRAGSGEDDVQWLVDLTTVDAADDVIALVAHTVGAADRTLSAVATLLSGRRALLILDNAEHVLGAVATLSATLLGECPGLSIIVTSRESLRMPGERVVVVPPLLGDDLGDAVELFRQRAARGAGGSVWSADQTADVERLCAALDGLPLAIELAASRLEGQTLAELAASVTDAVEPGEHRHASVERAIEWSVRLTTDAERDLLAQLAGFAAPVTLDVVDGVCRVPGHDVRALTVALARKSLLHAVAGEGDRRFRMLQVVRQYLHRRHPVADRDAWNARHAAWFRDAAVRLTRALDSPAAKAAKRELRASRADLEQALAWALGAGDRGCAVPLVAALGRHWAERGGVDPLGRIDAALALPGDPTPSADADALRAALLIGAVAGDPGRVVYDVQRYRRAAAVADEPLHRMLAASMSAFFAAARVELDEMDALLDEAETSRRAVPDEDAWGIADHLVIRGDALRTAGRPAQALAVLAEARTLAAEIGHGWARASAGYITGRTLLDVDRAAEALPVLHASAVRYLENEDAPMALTSALASAVALARAGRLEPAAELLATVDALGARLGFRGDAIDPGFAHDAREAVRGLPPSVRDAAERRGAARSLPGLVELLSAQRA